MEHRKADVRTVAACGMSGDDDTARFLHELRQLRDGAGLGHAQLAARAHYPYDSIKAAEVGPSLPDLPVLSAFVRGCGGPTQEWEERWRSLSSSPSLPVAATRQTGRSDAATAGARISSAAPEGDGPDPSVILAALNRVAEEMADPGDEAIPAPPVAQPAPALPSSSFSSAFTSNEPGAGSVFATNEPAAASVFAKNEPAAGSLFASNEPAAGSMFATNEPAAGSMFATNEPAAGSLFATNEPAAGSMFATNEPGAGAGGKPTGWDPIRVSSAWPALQYAPTLAEPAGNTGILGGAGSPGDGNTAWGTAPPWGAPAAEAPAATSSNTGDSAVAGTGAAGVRAAGGPGGLSRTTIAAIVLAAVVLLCVVVALLVALS